ncbi:MAG: Sporulation related domain protein [Alphaproteobacteria bacterium ADurb.Bin438]|nr:MAG: Sporulation related domain protein [Alphaproteobacteria bacterium ADurb.Bin438]
MVDNKNDQDFYKEFKDRMNIDPLREVMDDKKSNNHTFTIIFAVLTGIFVSSLIGWYVIGNLMVSKTGNLDDINELPVVQRSVTPIKIKPENEGGMKIDNQEKQVYDLIGQNNAPDISREKIVVNRDMVVAPSEDEYLINDNEYKEEVEASEDKIANLIKEVDNTNPEPKRPILNSKNEETPAPVNILPTEIKPLEKVAEVKEEVKIAETKPVETPKIEPKKEEVKVEAKQEVKIEPAPVEKPKAETKPSEIFKVQVLSTKDEAQVKKSYANLSKKIKEIKGLPYEIEKADLGKKGIYYRLKIGEFKSKEEAAKLCQTLKAKKQDCIVSKK